MCYKDEFNNMAKIEEHYRKPYYDANFKSKGYRLICMAIEDKFVYHVTYHENFEEAYQTMMTFSCGTWKKCCA